MAEYDEQILLFWDCPECGYAHIEGPTSRCPNCFWWRDRRVEFYEAPDSRVLTPAEAEKYSRPDWVCKVCGAANVDRGEPLEKLVCGNCDSEQVNYVDLEATRPEDLTGGQEVEKVTGEWEEGFRLDPAATETEAPPSPQKKIIRKKLVAGGTALAIAGSGWGIWQIATPDVFTATIQQRHWVVAVEVQENRPVQEGGWVLPTGAYQVQRSTRQRGTRQVQVGTRSESHEVSYREQTGTEEKCTTRSKGNGTATRSCRDVPVYTTKYRTETREVPVYRTDPVYDTWYNYTIKKWVKQTVLENRGKEAQQRLPPKVALDQKPYSEKALDPISTCQVKVSYIAKKKEGERQEEITVPCDQYDQLKTGQTVKLVKGMGGSRINTN